VAGVVVYQFPIDEVVRVMTGNFQWKQEGLGETGEVYLVGQDKLMRSRSRFMKEDPTSFLVTARDAGLPDKTLKALERQKNVLLVLPVDNESTRLALAGKDGVHEIDDYRRVPVVSAYGPFDFENIRWAVLAEMDSSEAYGPARMLARQALVTAVSLSLLISLLALWTATSFTRPLRQLTEAARKVSAGNIDTQVSIQTGDELQELGDAFNLMTNTLRQKTDQLEKTIDDNEDLLLNILPASAAARLREGDDQSRHTYPDVTVLIAELVGLEQAENGEEGAVAWLQHLVLAFDEAAERHGLEKLKTMGSTYVAACGLAVPVPDHPQRAVEFAQEMVRIVGLFNQERGAKLEIDIGINAGTVTGGIIGRRKFIYDLWGETVMLARFVVADGVSSIRVTQTIHERLQQQFHFLRQPDITLRSGRSVAVYQLNQQVSKELGASA
jgi:class 3 adenylate cyclase